MLSIASLIRTRPHARFLAGLFALAATLGSACADEPAAGRAPATISDLAALRNVGSWSLHHSTSLAVSGTITYVSTAGDSFVLQEANTAVSLHGQLDLSQVHVGTKVRVTASAVYPMVAGFPAFPFRPGQTEVIDRLHLAPSNALDYVDRLQAYVVPPVSGEYRFWIASDDSSELWLSTDESRENARPIASVPAWTFVAEWTTYRSQTSSPIALQAGRRYYIEVLHEQGMGADHIDVAWQGPSGPREVIPHANLIPWLTPAGAGDQHGVSREVWSPCTISSPADLQPASPLTNRFTVQDARIEILGTAPLPTPVAIKAGQPIEAGASFRWSEVVAELRAAQRSADGLDIELVDGESKMVAHVQSWSGDGPFDSRGYLVRLTGACEAAFNARGEVVPGTLWIPRLDRIAIVDASPSWEQLPAARVKDIAAATIRPDDDIPVRLKGRVQSHDGRRRLVIQEDTGISAFMSIDGKTWRALGDEIVTPLSDSVLAGLAVSSYGPQPAIATFDRLSGLVGPLTGTQIGNPTQHGELKREGDVLTVTGFGRDIWDWEDEFYFVQQPLAGDAEIVAHITPLQMPNTYSKAGLMIRDSLAPDAPFVDLVNVGRSRVSLQWRIRNPHHTTEAVYTSEKDAPGWLKLILRRRTIPVNLVTDAELTKGESVEALGYLKKSSSGIEIVHGFVRPLAPKPVPNAVDDERPLVDIQSLRAWRLSGLPNHFRVRGVVTCNYQLGWPHYFAVQDSSGGAFFSDGNQSNWRLLRPGMLVDIYGDPIASADPTALTANKVMIVGPGVMPTPLRHPAELTEPDKGEGRWVEVEGIVYATSGNTGILRAAGSYISVESAELGRDDWARLIDRKIRIQGVVSYRSTSEMTVFVPGKSYVETLGYDTVSSPSSPRSVADLSGGKPIGDPVHRERVVGTLTFIHGLEAIVDDGVATASVQLSVASSAAKVGDRVEVLGFPVVGADGALTLLYADIRAIGPSALPVALKSTVPEVLDGRFAQHFVTIEADLVTKGGTAAESFLEMQAGGRKFRAWCPVRSEKIDGIAEESRLRLTGFVSRASLEVPGGGISNGGLDRGALFIVPTPDNIVVLQGPPWVRLRRALYVLGGLAAVLIVVLAWVQVLRRRVRQRTEELHAAMQQLRQETELTATLTERQRVAGEIHDSLEQGISGIMLQLEGALQSPACPEDVRETITVARKMVSFTHAELRHAIWDLHSPILEGTHLSSALREMVQRLGTQTPAVGVEVTGDPSPLPPETEHHLLRIAQEAVTNALKHANASAITVRVDYRPDRVVLRIEDDGCGFATENLLVDGTHFGLRSLRRRAKKMNSRLDLSSGPRGGTRVEVVVQYTVEPVI